MIDKLAEYEKAANMMPGSVIIFQLNDDDTLRVLFYSQKAQELMGITQSEADGAPTQNGFARVIKDDVNLLTEKVKTAIAENEELDVVYRQHHKEKGVMWVHVNASIAGKVDGKPTFIASMLDVTQEMLNSSSIMEATDRAICVIEKNTKLLLYGNTLFYDLIKLKPSESMGVYCYDALCGNPEFKTNDKCLCFSTINIEKPFEYYNPVTEQYISMYGREIVWGEHEAYVFFLTDQTKEKFRENQLKNARERFEVTLDNSNLYVWEYDILNNQCINSEKAVREYGIPRVIDDYPESLFERGNTPPETVEQIKEVKKRLLNGESGFEVERRTIKANGESQWMKVFYTLQKDVHGRPARALVCGTDITELKQKQIEYEEELRLKKTVSDNTTILCVMDLTLDRVVENDAKNPLLEKYLDRGTNDEIMNAVCDELIVKSDRAAYRAHFNRAHMLSDFAHGVMHGSLRHQFAHRSGWFESAYDLLKNPTTGNVEAVTSIKNVTSEARLKQVVSKLTAIDYDMILTVDVASGRAYRYDTTTDEETADARELGREEYEDFARDTVKKYCTPEEAEAFSEATGEKHVLAMLEKMPVYTYVFAAKASGNPVCKRYIYTYLDASHKTVLCARQDATESYLQDEQQRRALTEALEKAEIANKAKTAFLSRVSHDMRTPLNGVLGMTALMKDELASPGALQDLKNLELSGKYLLDLINDVLDMSSIESGSMKLNPAVCDGRMVLNNLAKMIKPNMDKKSIAMVMNTNDMTFAPCYIDEARLQQIAMNVLGNAVKFTNPGGRVEFTGRTLSVERGVIVNEFIVKDNGIGMDPAFIPHLFEPFSQENAAITNSKNGTGLGMSITKNIVELMNGSIEVESEKGVGTTVRVVLESPIATEEQVKKSRAALQPRVSNHNLEGRRVLLCEDHALNRQIATRLLQKVGLLVECAENGSRGVEMFQNAPMGYYDAVLMDIRMPIMDGLEATRTIRALPRPDAAKVPILAMTANALDEDVRNTLEAGMNAHISKPIDPMQLYQNLDKYINVQREALKIKVLIVDDVEVNRAVLVETLKPNYEVVEATNGVEALEIMEKVKGVSLVITDIEMPQMGGRDLIRAVRSKEENRHVAIIAYTQYEKNNQEEHLLQLGANDFLYKPLNPKVVELRVKNALFAVM